MPIAFAQAQPSLNPIPAHQLLVAFRNGPLDDHSTFVVDAPGVPPQPGHWTDLSAYWDRAEPRRGRQQQTGYFEAGTLAAHLRNYNGEFNTFGQSGLYTPYLDLGRPVKHRVTVGGTTYDRFTGFLTSVKPLWPDVMSTEVELLASDLFRHLNVSKLGADTYRNKLMALGATDWWRCNDSGIGGVQPGWSQSYLASSTVKNSLGSVAGNTNAGLLGMLAVGGAAGPLLTQPGSGAISLPYDAKGNAPSITFTVSPPPTVWTFVAWFGGLSQGNGSFIAASFSPGGANTFGAALDPAMHSAFLQYTVWDNAGVKLAAQGTVAVADGGHHQIGVIWSASGISFVIDGALDVTIAATLGSHNGIRQMGRQLTATPFQGGGMWVSEASSFPTALTVANVLSLYQTGLGYIAEDTGSRVASVLTTAVGLPAALQAVDTGVQQCQANKQNLVRTGVLSFLEQVEQTEEGALFMTGAGKVRFVARDQLATSAPYATVQATFGDRVNRAATPGAAWGTATWGAAKAWGDTATGIVDIPYQPGVDIGLDDLNVVNQPDVTRVNGATQSYYGTNQAGPHGLSRSNVLHLTDACSLQHAKWLLDKYSNSRTELRRVTVELTDFLDDPVMLGRVLKLDLLHRVEVRRDQVGFRQVGLIEHIDEHVDARAFKWSITFSIAVADTYPTWQWAGSPQ